jgi:hypothetical protein
VTYLEVLAGEIYAASHRGAALPDAEKFLYVMYAVVCRALGVKTTAANVHDAWAAWMLSQSPEHPSLQPFDHLSLETQRKDERYAEAIRMVARRRPENQG